jgi:nicotinate-nucleotide pyrophosphorylase (carboxylating)
MTLEAMVRAALEEDVGACDWTTKLLILPSAAGSAQVISKAAGVLSGLDPFSEVYRLLDSSIKVSADFQDGSPISAGAVVLHLEGPVAGILTGERTALNFLQRLSGIATLTRQFVAAIQGTKAIILDTRKTTPLLRSLEKAAVRHGGGSNHRAGLYDMILIKENHIAAAGGISAAIWQAKLGQQKAGLNRPLLIEIEVQNLEQLEEALKFDIDRIMLDNFQLPEIRRAVERAEGRVPLEVSGGINIANVREIALCGVDYVSIGALTHSATAHDFSLMLNP